eukprot:4328123-Amphidinium_carterae.2
MDSCHRRAVNVNRKSEAEQHPYDEGKGAAIQQYSRPRQEYPQHPYSDQYSQQQYSRGWYSDAWSERANRWYSDARDQDTGARSSVDVDQRAAPKRPAPTPVADIQSEQRPAPKAIPPRSKAPPPLLREQGTPSDVPQRVRPTTSCAGEGARLEFPAPPRFAPMEPELPDWALTNPFRTPRIGLLMDMPLVANHLL